MLSLTRNKFPSSFLIWIPFTCFFGPICWAQQFWRSPVPTPTPQKWCFWGGDRWCLRLKVGALYIGPDPWSVSPFSMLIFGSQHLFHLTLAGAGVAWVGGPGRWEEEAWEGWPWALDIGYRAQTQKPFHSLPISAPSSSQLPHLWNRARTVLYEEYKQSCALCGT